MPRLVALDCETHLIKTGMLFPKLVCVSEASADGERLYKAEDGMARVRELLSDPDTILVFHNASFDNGVFCAEDASLIPEIFAAYRDGRIVCTMVCDMLHAIATGVFQEIEGGQRATSFSLASCVKKWLNLELNKADTPRLRYAEFEDLPLDQWPRDAVDYAKKDARVTLDLYAKLQEWATSEGSPDGKITDQDPQIRAAWVLHLMAGWGVRIDSAQVEVVRAALELQVVESHKVMESYGIFKVDKKGRPVLTEKGRRAKNLKVLQKLIADGYALSGEKPPMTPGRVNKKTGERIPEVSTSADAALESGHPAAIEYANSANAEKLLGTYIPALKAGDGGIPVTSSPNVLVASGRTSWGHPNWQNPPKIGGIRECVIPRQGNVFVGADLDTVELRALAQTCLELFGSSEMARALQRGEDLHTSLGADLLGISYQSLVDRLKAGDPESDEIRGLAKKINFGLPGGMGAPKFARTCENDGTPLAPTLEAAQRKAALYKEAWFRRWPEMRKFLAHAGQICSDWGTRTVIQPYSGRVRAGLEYCAAANTHFQGRVADGAKLALWRLAWACYVDTASPLFGARPVLFLHDEVILECREEVAHECALELQKNLCAAVQEAIPDVPITSTPVVMRRWLKGAKPVTLDGRLVPSRAEVVSVDEVTGKKKIRWVADVLVSSGEATEDA